jgi:hypothetical protein
MSNDSSVKVLDSSLGCAPGQVYGKNKSQGTNDVFAQMMRPDFRKEVLGQGFLAQKKLASEASAKSNPKINDAGNYATVKSEPVAKAAPVAKDADGSQVVKSDPQDDGQLAMKRDVEPDSGDDIPEGGHDSSDDEIDNLPASGCESVIFNAVDASRLAQVHAGQEASVDTGLEGSFDVNFNIDLVKADSNDKHMLSTDDLDDSDPEGQNLQDESRVQEVGNVASEQMPIMVNPAGGNLEVNSTRNSDSNQIVEDLSQIDTDAVSAPVVFAQEGNQEESKVNEPKADKSFSLDLPEEDLFDLARSSKASSRDSDFQDSNFRDSKRATVASVDFAVDDDLRAFENFAVASDSSTLINKNFSSFEQKVLSDNDLGSLSDNSFASFDDARQVFSFDDKMVKFNPTDNIIEFTSRDLVVADQISAATAYMKKIGQSQVTLKLNPADLGKINVRIVFAADQKTIQKINISAENRNTLADLKVAVEQLRASLSTVTNVKDTELTFDLEHNFSDNHGAFNQKDSQRKSQQSLIYEKASIDAIDSYDIEKGYDENISKINIRV